MTRRICTMTVLLVALGWLVTAETNAQKDAGNANADDLQQLLQQRHDVLQVLYEVAKSQFQNARQGREELVSAHDALLKAKLELAKSKEEKLDICKQRIDNFRQLEEFADAQFRTAEGTKVAKLVATAERLQAEIDCVRIESQPE